jgi:hypothetical protein
MVILEFHPLMELPAHHPEDGLLVEVGEEMDKILTVPNPVFLLALLLVDLEVEVLVEQFLPVQEHQEL